METVKQFTFVINGGLGRVDILADIFRRFTENPTGKSDHPTGAVKERENDSAPETIVPTALALFTGPSRHPNRESSPLQILGRPTLLAEMTEEAAPLRRRPTERELFNRFFGQTAFGEISEHRPGPSQLRFVITRRRRQDLINPIQRRVALKVVALQLEARPLGQNLEGAQKIQPFNFFHKANQIAAFLTTEAMVRLAGGRDEEGGCSFLMEGATGFPVDASFLQFEITADQVNDIQFGLDLFNGV